MSWRTVVVSRPSKLEYCLGYLVVRDIESTVKVHISEISILIIENTCSSVTTALLSELSAKKVKIIFCDEKRNPQSELTSYYGCHDCSSKLKEQLGWGSHFKQEVWTAIVSEKIRNQAITLEDFGIEKAYMLYGYLDEITFNDETNREGHAAKVYFNALFGMDFTRDNDCPVNAALNYGYSLILSCFNREIVCGGYLTQLGLFHDNMFNQYNFSCDLMEPFRPYIDSIVKNINPQKFEKEEKIEILKVLSTEIIIDSRTNSFINAIKIYCKSVFDSLNSHNISLIKFPYKENDI